MASPLIEVIKQNHPDAAISWLVQPESASLLNDHPDIDQVIVWDRSHWRQLLARGRLIKLLGAVRQHRKLLRDKEFDLVVDLQGLLKSGIHAWLSGAKSRIGLGSKEGSQHLMTQVVPRDGNTALIGSEYSYLADQLGWEYTAFPMHVAISERAGQDGRALLENLSAYCVICPFTTRPQKHWFNDAWLELISAIQARLGWQVVMLGGPADVAAAAQIESESSSDIVNLVGQTSLQEAAAIIDMASAVVGVDTGLTHMGIAFDTPTVAIFGSTCPYLDTRTTQAKVIYHDLACAPCQRNPTCGGAFNCLRDITAKEVMTALQHLTAVAPA